MAHDPHTALYQRSRARTLGTRLAVPGQQLPRPDVFSWRFRRQQRLRRRLIRASPAHRAFRHTPAEALYTAGLLSADLLVADLLAASLLAAGSPASFWRRSASSASISRPQASS